MRNEHLDHANIDPSNHIENDPDEKYHILNFIMRCHSCGEQWSSWVQHHEFDNAAQFIEHHYQKCGETRYTELSTIEVKE